MEMKMSNDLKDQPMDEPGTDPMPVKWPLAGVLSRALAYASYNIRKKNRAAQQNGGIRVPLDGPIIPLD
jgi:hypothetical protein